MGFCWFVQIFLVKFCLLQFFLLFRLRLRCPLYEGHVEGVVAVVYGQVESPCRRGGVWRECYRDVSVGGRCLIVIHGDSSSRHGGCEREGHAFQV